MVEAWPVQWVRLTALSEAPPIRAGVAAAQGVVPPSSLGQRGRARERRGL